MTDREKLIAYIEEIEGLYNNGFPSIEQLADGLIARGVTFATDNNVGSNWIPVTERLPELENYIYSEDVMFYLAHDDIRIGYINFESGRWKCRESRQIFDKDLVTHWMPLPNLPKEV